MTSPIRDPRVQEYIEKATLDGVRQSQGGTVKVSVTFDFKNSQLLSISHGFSSSRLVFNLPKK